LLVTALAPVIGNEKASKIAHHAMDRDLIQTEDSIVGTGAGKRCRDLDRRKIDLRQRRDRGDDANEEDRRHEAGRHVFKIGKVLRPASRECSERSS
jgi:hypothetical protein